MNESTNPLQSLLSHAARRLPRQTGEMDRFEARYRQAGCDTVVLCDVSSSMSERAGSGRKIDHLREAVAAVWPIENGRLYVFSSHVEGASDPSQISEPSGGTALHLALITAEGLRPWRTLVISDGRPDDEAAALAAAERLTGTIDVIYCGPDDDARGIEFMRRLARTGCGRLIVRDLVKMSSPSLTADVRQILALPAPR